MKRTAGPERRRVEDHVVSDVAEHFAESMEALLKTDADRGEIVELGGMDVGRVSARDGEHFERGTAPIGA